MKRKVPVNVARGILAKVPIQYSFWLCTNENLRSIEDVSKALQKATDDVFRYHVNRDKNDFEAWIRDVIKDKDLAREIARVKTKETLVRKITERIESLRSIMKKNVPKRTSRPKRPKSRSKKRKQRRLRKAPRRHNRRRKQAKRPARKGRKGRR